jgi:23S rRNA pseudouridine2605 synthase
MAKPKMSGSPKGRRTSASADKKTTKRGSSDSSKNFKKGGVSAFKKGRSEDSFKSSRSEGKSFAKRPSRGGFEGDADKSFTKKPFSKGSSSSRFGAGEGRSNSAKSSRFSSREGEEKKSFRNERPRRGSSFGDSERPARRSFKNEDSTERKSFRKSSDAGDERPRRGSSFGDSERPARRSFKNEDSTERKSFRKSSDAGDERPRRNARNEEGSEKRTYRKKSTDGDSSTDRPVRNSRFASLRQDDGPRAKRSDRYKSFRDKEDVYEAPAQTEKIRLNRFISNSGVCSRREADNLIGMGLISVNGKTITELGYKVNPGDQVRYEDRVLRAEKPVYVLMNKPKGFLTTTMDPQERNTVMHILGNNIKERIYPVGRLDRNTTGLLLLTNDGEMADKLMHPSHNVKKIYKVDLDRPLTKGDFQKIMEGIQLEEGRAKVDDLAIVSEDGKTVGIELHIGWNRVVRRIFESLGYEVVRLDRSVYAGLDKKDLSRGQWRFLKKEEIARLKQIK